MSRRQMVRRRHKMIQRYEQDCANRINGRSGVIPVKVAPGNKPGYHSMSRQEGDALTYWVQGYRSRVMNIKGLLRGDASWPR